MSDDVQPDEVVIARARPGWGGLLRDALETTVIILAVMLLLSWWKDGRFPVLAEWLIWATICPALIFGMNVLFWSVDRWVLTNQRVIDARRNRSVPLAALKPVSRSRWGEARLFAHDGTGFWLRAIPPAFLAQIEAARQSASEKVPHV